jgi:hypothetical protein
LAKYAVAMSAAQLQEKEALEISGKQAFGALPLPSVPIVVLSGTKTNPFVSAIVQTREAPRRSLRENRVKPAMIERPA